MPTVYRCLLGSMCYGSSLALWGHWRHSSLCRSQLSGASLGFGCRTHPETLCFSLRPDSQWGSPSHKMSIGCLSGLEWSRLCSIKVRSKEKALLHLWDPLHSELKHIKFGFSLKTNDFKIRYFQSHWYSIDCLVGKSHSW